jgi:hypothetical protein
MSIEWRSILLRIGSDWVMSASRRVDLEHPKEAALREVRATIRNICGGAVGSMAASGIVAKLAKCGIFQRWHGFGLLRL